MTIILYCLKHGSLTKEWRAIGNEQERALQITSAPEPSLTLFISNILTFFVQDMDSENKYTSKFHTMLMAKLYCLKLGYTVLSEGTKRKLFSE